MARKDFEIPKDIEEVYREFDKKLKALIRETLQKGLELNIQDPVAFISMFIVVFAQEAINAFVSLEAMGLAKDEDFETLIRLMRMHREKFSPKEAANQKLA